MGVVYLCVESEANFVAIKTLPARRWNDSRAVARFIGEIDLARRFDHPNVVRSLDAGRAGGVPFLVMEYADGMDLARLSSCCGRLSIADACEIARQLALGLKHIHEQKVIHRDIKPSNAVLTRKGTVKILDVGLALAFNEGQMRERYSFSEQVVGSLDYMAPEQASNSRAVSPAVDLYGLGATLFQLLSGNPPFFGAEFNSPLKKFIAATTRQAPRVTEFRPDVPDQLASLVACLLAKNPADRVASACDLAAALYPFAEGSNLAQLIPATITKPAARLAEQMHVDTSSDWSSDTIEFVS
jgi:serine/threonine protein kinase